MKFNQVELKDVQGYGIADLIDVHAEAASAAWNRKQHGDRIIWAADNGLCVITTSDEREFQFYDEDTGVTRLNRVMINVYVRAYTKIVGGKRVPDGQRWYTSEIYCEVGGISAFVVKEAMDIVIQECAEGAEMYWVDVAVKELIGQMQPVATIDRFRAYKNGERHEV